MTRPGAAVAVFGLLLLFGARPAAADTTMTITFDGPAVAPVCIGVTYGNQGVLLPTTARVAALPTAMAPYKAHSGTGVLVSRPWVAEFDADPLVIDFTQGVHTVALYTGAPYDTRGHAITIQLEAFATGGNRVDAATLTLRPPTDVTTPMQVKAPYKQNIITRIRVTARSDSGVGTFEVIDDLSWTAEGPAPVLAREPPHVTLSSPAVGNVSAGDINIAGEVAGEGLMPVHAPPELSVSWAVPPQSTKISEDVSHFALGSDMQWSAGAGSSLKLSRTYALTWLGENTIEVTACNAKGSDSAGVAVTYFPPAIQTEYQKQPGKYGQFSWGGAIDGCMVAMYTTGAIFLTNGNAYPVFDEILTEWRNHPDTLGCATSAARDVIDPTGQTLGSAQDFTGGRIYSVAAQGSAAVAYHVVEPFVDAIDRMAADSVFLGLPAGDPVRQQKVLLPALWQKFERRLVQGGLSYTLTSVMEVTASPLTLWIATTDLEAAKAAGAFGDPWTKYVANLGRLPSVWYSFSCGKAGAPCQNVRRPAAASRMPYSNLGKACGGHKYPCDAPLWAAVLDAAATSATCWQTPQWAALKTTKEIVPFIGTISVAPHVAGEDAAWNHACSVGTFGGVDMNAKVIPDRGYEPLLSDKQTSLEIEYEWCLVGYPTPVDPLDIDKGPKDEMKVGDRLLVAGRWISDCGCHPWYTCAGNYQSEIHPPALMVNMYTGEALSQPATIGDVVYFDWWYPGQTVEIDIFPPPRPAPDAVLSYSVPLWPTMCTSDGGKCGIAATDGPSKAPNHVRLKFSGRPDVVIRTPPKEDSGNGQLYHGYAPNPPGKRGPVPPGDYPHTKSLVGPVIVGWAKSPTT